MSQLSIKWPPTTLLHALTPAPIMALGLMLQCHRSTYSTEPLDVMVGKGHVEWRGQPTQCVGRFSPLDLHLELSSLAYLTTLGMATGEQAKGL